MHFGEVFRLSSWSDIFFGVIVFVACYFGYRGLGSVSSGSSEDVSGFGVLSLALCAFVCDILGVGSSCMNVQGAFLDG